MILNSYINQKNSKWLLLTDIAPALLGRLVLNEKKIDSLVAGMKQIADNTNILGKVVKCTKLTNDLILQQITVPLGVLLVIFESRPDSLPQVNFINILFHF